MAQFATYLISASLIMCVLYLFGRLLLMQDKHYNLIRVMWLAICGVSLLLPLLDLSSGSVGVGGVESMVAATQSDEVGEVASRSVEASSYSNIVFTTLSILYLLGVLVTLTLKLKEYRRLILLIRSSRCRGSEFDGLVAECEAKVGLSQRVRYTIHDRELSPFSWMGHVVVSRRDLQTSGTEVLVHELAHCKMRHSWDILLLDILSVVMWFNPAVWLIKGSLKLSHEYAADDMVIKGGFDATNYQLLLIKRAVGNAFYTMSNSLNHSNLKQRITMMKKSKKSVLSTALRAVVVAIVAVCSLLLLNSSSARAYAKVVESYKFTQNFSSKQGSLNIDATTINEVPPLGEDYPVMFSEVSPVPIFIAEDATLNDFRVWLASQMEYPSDIAKLGIGGRIHLSFIIEKDGSVSSVKILKSDIKCEGVLEGTVDLNDFIDGKARLEKIATDAIQSSPKWTAGENKDKPVRFNYRLPIDFTASGK